MNFVARATVPIADRIRARDLFSRCPQRALLKRRGHRRIGPNLMVSTCASFASRLRSPCRKRVTMPLAAP